MTEACHIKKINVVCNIKDIIVYFGLMVNQRLRKLCFIPIQTLKIRYESLCQLETMSK